MYKFTVFTQTNKNVSRETWGDTVNFLFDCLKAFAVGSAICVIGQLLIDCTKLTPARILVSYVVSGVILTGIGMYGGLVEFAGAGATVPLTGFGYSLAKGVEKAVDEYGLIGALTGGLTATAAGITTAIVMGLLMALIFKSKDK
ncbi:MAG: stage V sporulation protein AE [Clostridia bacterium]|nr:stage V sporulation protein AE [Clostridia bacterium]